MKHVKGEIVNVKMKFLGNKNFQQWTLYLCMEVNFIIDQRVYDIIGRQII